MRSPEKLYAVVCENFEIHDDCVDNLKVIMLTIDDMVWHYPSHAEWHELMELYIDRPVMVGVAPCWDCEENEHDVDEFLREEAS